MFLSTIGVYNLCLTNNRNLAYQFIIQLPLTGTLLPIAFPTFYLWVVDTLALKRGTWVIESETKFEWHLWHGLEIECEISTPFREPRLTNLQRSSLLPCQQSSYCVWPHCF